MGEPLLLVSCYLWVKANLDHAFVFSSPKSLIGLDSGESTLFYVWETFLSDASCAEDFITTSPSTSSLNREILREASLRFFSRLGGAREYLIVEP